MKLLSSLFGTAAARAKVAGPASQQVSTRAAGDARRTVHVQLESAQLLLQGTSAMEVRAEGPIDVQSTPDGIQVTERFHTNGPPPICRLEVPAGASVDLHLKSGGLTVRRFQGTLRARIQSGGVSVEQSSGRFRVVVPNSRVTFERVRGEIDVLTSNGTVLARQTEGGLQAVSSGGSIELDDVNGPVVARTTNGSIEASDVHGSTRLSTRTGEVRISGECGPLKVRTQSGDVTLKGSVTAHTTLETLKGNLDLKLGPHTNAHLQAKVGQGVVRTERIAPLPGSSRRTLRSTVGLGEFRLRLESGWGAINVAGPPKVARAPKTTAYF